MTPALVNGVLSPLLQSDLFADERWLLLRVFVGASVESLLLFDDGDAGWVQVTDSPKPLVA